MVDFLAQRRMRGSHRRAPALVLLAFIALMLASVAAPASGAPSYRAVEWGLFAGKKPVQVGELLGVTAVAADTSTARSSDSILGMALLDNGTVMDWTVENPFFPMPASGLAGVTAITAGSYNLALLSNGTVMEVAANSAPVPVSGITDASAIGSSGSNGAALLSDGTLRTWGSNTYGELGNGLSGEASEVPVEVCAVGTEGPCPHGPYLTGVKAVAVGEYFILALMNDGTVAAWGYDALGELGGGCCGSPYIPNPTPVPISGLSGVQAISAGGNHGDALMSDGTVEEWGGTVDGNGVATPSPVGGLSNVTAISSGNGFSMALVGNGTVMTWGDNSVGQLGTGGKPRFSAVPVLVPNLTGVAGVDAGAYTALAFGPAPAPAVKKLSIRTGSVTGGTPVTITGTNFTGATAVKFGATDAASYTVTSKSSISAVSPEHALGFVDVTVTTPSGTSAITSADRFKFTPTVTNVSPRSGPTAGGTIVTVTGTGFVLGTSATQFKFGTAKPRTGSCTSTTECTVASPAHAVGTVDVKATVNKISSVQNAPADQFTYE